MQSLSCHGNCFIVILLEKVALSCILACYITITKCFLWTFLCNCYIFIYFYLYLWEPLSPSVAAETTFLTLFTCHHHLLHVLLHSSVLLVFLLLFRIILINVLLNLPFTFVTSYCLPPFLLLLSSLHFFFSPYPETLLSHFLTHLPVFVFLSQAYFYSCISHCILIIMIPHIFSLPLH